MRTTRVIQTAASNHRAPSAALVPVSLERRNVSRGEAGDGVHRLDISPGPVHWVRLTVRWASSYMRMERTRCAERRTAGTEPEPDRHKGGETRRNGTSGNRRAWDAYDAERACESADELDILRGSAAGDCTGRIFTSFELQTCRSHTGGRVDLHECVDGMRERGTLCLS